MGDAEDPVHVTADIWNRDTSGDKSIAFTAPCPPIGWAGQMAGIKEFIVSGVSQGSAVEVTIFNKVCQRGILLSHIGSLTDNCFLRAIRTGSCLIAQCTIMPPRMSSG